uniref:NIM1-interacting protein n=1 Tax=Cannabis sativa TaxID=3483 RepID=A0A803NPX7_CANSA
MEMGKGNMCKKRKLSHVVVRENEEEEEEEEEEGEEEKIEKFYELIRSMREARDRLIKPISTTTDHHHHQTPDSLSWKPSFEHEDFITGKNANGQEIIPTSNFKVPKTNQTSLLTTATFIGTSSAAAVPNQVPHTNNVSSKELLDLTLSL